jgi:hypothetical protein
MLMQTETALAYDISGLAPALQSQIRTDSKARALFARFPDKLLGLDTNAKTVKGERYGVKTAILYLMPADQSGAQLCPMAELARCKAPCLFTAGRGAMSNVMLSRLRKTLYFLQHRELFMAQLAGEIAAYASKAKRQGFKLVVRLNGTSDIRWENIAMPGHWGLAGDNIFRAFPAVQFYDYTKIANRRNIPANYDLTFSYSGAPEFAPFVDRAVANGERIAVVFRHRAIVDAMLANGERFLGLPVVDGDDSDIRHLDPRGAVVALYAKGKARQDTSGFVVG